MKLTFKKTIDVDELAKKYYEEYLSTDIAFFLETELADLYDELSENEILAIKGRIKVVLISLLMNGYT